MSDSSGHRKHGNIRLTSIMFEQAGQVVDKLVVAQLLGAREVRSATMLLLLHSTEDPEAL